MITAKLALAAATLAQPANASAQPPAPTTTPPHAATDLSPPALLAKRIAAVRAEMTVAPILVLAPDERSFVTALTAWRTEKGRVLFPILIDNGSAEARENIARFSRAFKPARIVRLKPGADPQRPVGFLETAAALYSTFGATDEAGYLTALNERKSAPGPLGVVAAQADNPAGLALAAAYGQVLVITDPPAKPDADFGLPAADKLSDVITAHLTVVKVPYQAMGDQIDAVTLCFDVRARVLTGPKNAPANQIPQLAAKPDEGLALTDIIGRETENNRTSRWAYASQLTGASPQAAYRAMCAIFLQPTSAVAFNGYERTGEFGKYNPADGLTALKGAGLTTALLDRPSQSAEDWRQWSSGSFSTRYPDSAGAPPKPAGGALTSDLFLVNTMGNRDFFQLAQGSICYAGDVPFLSLPAVVDFNHSWSLQISSDPTTVGGRWLDRGAYCYVGSVHEPYLSAFVYTSDFATRLTRGWPIAAAARIQANDRPFNPFSAPWRVAVMGDALWTLGPALRRTTDLPAFAGATDLAAELPAEGRAGRYANVLDSLAILGRDADAARWARTLVDDAKFDHATAQRAVMAAYRAGDSDTLVKAAQRFNETAPPAPGEPLNTTIADAVWHALYPRLTSLTADQANLLTRFIRPYSYAWDTISAATALKRAISDESGRAFFDQQCQKATDPQARKRLEEARSGLFR